MENRWVFGLLLFPSLGFLLLFVIFPLIWAGTLSFTSYDLFQSQFEFIGLANYLSLFKDPGFYNSLKVTLTFVPLAVAGHIFLGLTFANLVNIPDLFGKRFISIIILIPWITPSLVAGFMWKSVLNVDYGWLNSILSSFGVEPINWLYDFPLISILLPNWSRGMAISFLILSAALQSIPSRIYEAAQLDGASPWQTFFYIKIPLMRYSLLVALLVGTFGTLRAFAMIYTLTGGGPMGQTEVFSVFIYKTAFSSMKLGYAGAISVVFSLVGLALAFIYIRSIKVEV